MKWMALVVAGAAMVGCAVDVEETSDADDAETEALEPVAEAVSPYTREQCWIGYQHNMDFCNRRPLGVRMACWTAAGAWYAACLARAED